MNPEEEGRRIELRGTVQGVGLRPWVYRHAIDVGIQGRVRNAAGGVTIDAYGSLKALETFIARLEKDAPPAARISRLSWQVIAPEPERSFKIDSSECVGTRTFAIPADLPTCERCLLEVFDRADRRYGYAFTTCTDCGPRFSIAHALPYDRANTSMSGFTMCVMCEREYHSPDSRRFHAETNACPACGPSLTLLDKDGRRLAADRPLQAAAAALANGAIVAIKGLGGYHLACDANDENAVERLRQRKRRDTKPFAVMVQNLAEANRLVEISSIARKLLESPERPIVLLPRHTAGAIADQVAPMESRLGVLLPYTPLHHLLLALVPRPLVMTSANRADEPTVYRDDAAVIRLAGIADMFLTHDREIVTLTDDSVATVVGGEPLVVRRSRGYVPRVVRLSESSIPAEHAIPAVVAYGASLKNTCCCLVDEEAYLGPHVGDLDTLESFQSMADSIAKMEHFFDVGTPIVAHDLHPDYLSTQLARERPAIARFGVQHHHAHIASAMVENQLSGSVLGLAWDGGGFGTDGATWGSELLLADFVGFRRLATFRPVRLAGGDIAIREIWRLALAILDDAYDGRPPLSRIPLFDSISADRIALVRQMIATGVNTPASHGLGRWIDAIAAIVLAAPYADYEAQLAVRWEQTAADATAPAYDVDIDDASTGLWLVDLRPAVRTAVSDLGAGIEAAAIAARFHATLVAAAAELIHRAIKQHGPLPVVAAGGCFQNARIIKGLDNALAGAGPLYRNRAVPTGDGGIALGQAAVARACYVARQR